MLISNKHFTPVIGLDIHFVILFGFPIPLPHPYIGLVVDPMDYIPFVGATTKVNHVPRGKSDTSGRIIILFHIPMGGPFLLTPIIGHDSVNFYGSKKVKVEGNLMSPSGHMLMTCNDIGMPLSLQPGKKFIPIPSLYLPTSFSIPLSFGKPVNVGGPFVPDWAGVLLNLIMSYGFGAALKALGKLGKKALSKFNHALQKKIGSNKLSDKLCKKGFEPVDLVQGIVIYDGTDFELNGPIPLQWSRSWNSDSPFEGVLGHGTHFSYDMRVLEFPQEDVSMVLLGNGRSAVFDILSYSGARDYNRHEQLTLVRTDIDEYELLEKKSNYTYTFRKLHPTATESRLVAIRDEAGFLISFHYNHHEQLVRIIDSADRHLYLTNDDNGRILKVTARHRDEEKVMVEYAYNEAGDLTDITDALGQTTCIRYDNHLMVEKTDRNGQTFYWEYEEHRCVHTWGEGGLLEGFLEYHPDKGYNRITNSLGHTTTYYYTPDFVVTQIKDPMGNSTFYQYTEHMEIYRVIDAEGNATGYTYDDAGNLTTIGQPGGNKWQYAYNADGKIILAADAEGNSRTYIYHEKNGLLHTLTEADGHIKIFRYNEKNLISKIQDERDNATLFEYDEDHNLTQITLADGSSSHWDFDAWGQCVRMRNPLQQEQTMRYDALGRPVTIRLPDGNKLQLQYNAYEEVTAVTDKYRELRFAYTPMGKVKLREENGVKIHFRYNTEDQLTGIVNELGESYSFERNSNGAIIRETGFDQQTRHYHRDAAGKVLRTDRPGNRWTEYEYDHNGWLSRAEYSDGTWETFSYNRNGQLAGAANEHGSFRMVRDALGRMVEEWQDGHQIFSRYDKQGRRVQLQSSLGANIQLQRNALGDVTGIRAHTDENTPWEAGIQRNPLGQEIERMLPGNVHSSWEYDSAGAPLQHTVQQGNRITRRKQYHWDPNLRLRQILDGLSHGAISFGHDDFGSLAWAQYEDGQYDYKMPDKGGNIFKTAVRNDRKYGPGGQLLETENARFIYDEEGNLTRKIVTSGAFPVTWEYEWYGNGMLKQVRRPDQQVITFRYDPMGRRTEKVYRGMVTRFLWDENILLHEWQYPVQDRPVTTVDETGNVAATPEPIPPETLITWVFEEDFTPAAKITGNGQYSVICDYLGTPAEAYDTAGNKVWETELDIYGNVRKLAGDKTFVPFRYQGQYEDAETGLYYNRLRYYSPGEGNYISQDPIRLAGNNPTCYGYVKDSNVEVDVFGLDCATTKKLQAHADAARAEAKLSVKQEASIQRSLDRAAAATDPKTKAYHEMMAKKKERMYMGTQVDTIFKNKVDADEDLAHLSTTPRGKFGPDVYDPKANKYWDLTTDKDWGKGGHQSKYDDDFGEGTGIFW